MTSLLRAAAGWIFVGCASSAACAIVGYDFDGYSPSGAGGSGGSDTTTAQGTGNSTTSGSSTSGTPTSGPSSSTTSGSASSSGSGGSQPCLDVADCEDMNPCTTDVCSSGLCAHVPVDTDDDNACTTDGCDPSTGQGTHTAIPNCCPHSVCTEGVSLSGSCTFTGAPIDCVPEICGSYAHCCNMGWNLECVQLAKAGCGSVGSITCACAHSYCVAGSALVSNCDPCVEAICKVIPSCCMTAWDDMCVAATHTFCHIPLGSNCQ